MEDLGKLIVAKGFKSCPNSNKLPKSVHTAVDSKASFALGYFVQKTTICLLAPDWQLLKISMTGFEPQTSVVTNCSSIQ